MEEKLLFIGRSAIESLDISVAEIIAHLSKFITLRPGDIISTGTPSGVGMGMDPPVFLKAGDNIKLGISDLGQQFQKVIAF